MNNKDVSTQTSQDYIIYKIYNHDDASKLYIGSTSYPLNIRWRWHINSSKRGYCGRLYDDIRKLGSDKFVIEVVENLNNSSKLSAKRREGEYITKLKNDGVRLYNTNIAGRNRKEVCHAYYIKSKLLKKNL